jgi:hypothetical protein
MDHLCYKCGQSIEERKVFCSHCGAPQIRVAVAESDEPANAANVSSGDQSRLSLDPSTISGALRAPIISAGIEWRRAFWCCVAAAVISVVVASSRLIAPLFAVLGSGILAVILYYRRNPGPPASARPGAKIGAVTGLISASVSGLFFAIFVAVMHSGGELQKQMMDALQQFVTKANDPQVQATFDLLRTPEGLNKLMWGMVGLFLISIAAGCISGALTGALLGRRKRP